MPVYRNKLDGRIIETTTAISGDNWEEYDPKAPEVSEADPDADEPGEDTPAPKKKKAKK